MSEYPKERAPIPVGACSIGSLDVWQMAIYGNYEVTRYLYATKAEALSSYERARKRAAFAQFRIEVLPVRETLCLTMTSV